MNATLDATNHEALVATLRARGARFAFLHGSRVDGNARADSDLDVGAWWGAEVDEALEAVSVPAGVDLLVLDTAPLDIAGRVALHGQLLFDDDPPARVAWQAETRKRYLDEAWRREAIRRDFVAAHRG